MKIRVNKLTLTLLAAALVSYMVYDWQTNGPVIQYIRRLSGAEHFSQTWIEELNPFGSYQGKPYTGSQQDRMDKCTQRCDLYMRSCLQGGNPTTCQHNYKVCRQDCGWDAKINTPQ